MRAYVPFSGPFLNRLLQTSHGLVTHRDQCESTFAPQVGHATEVLWPWTGHAMGLAATPNHFSHEVRPPQPSSPTCPFPSPPLFPPLLLSSPSPPLLPLLSFLSSLPSFAALLALTFVNLGP